MLTEIRSSAFRKGYIKFNASLNVVLGDTNATNSIGKSTALMVIDFVFGGKSFLEFNKDAVEALGEHAYEFCFKFHGVDYFFRRDTITPNSVLRCNSDYVPGESIELSSYLDWLKEKYIPEKHALTFRAFVGIFSRVWPKDNVSNVRRPLHAVANESASDCIADLIKIFGRYDEIQSADDKLKSKENERKALKRAVDFSIIEKIGSKQYSKNVVDLTQVSAEVNEIKTDLAKFALNIRALADKELLELKQSKDMLLLQRLKVDEKLARTQKNLRENKHVRSEQLDALIDFFPEVNVQRIAQIEEFHSTLASLLKKELTQSQTALQTQRERIEIALTEIDVQIGNRLSNYDNPTALVDRVYELSDRWSKLKRENDLYERQTKIEQDYASLKGHLSKLKVAILLSIELKINSEIGEIVTRVYGQNAKAPTLSLKENSYSYEIVDDTGTGKAFANLVIFDLAMFALTDLPILIHDSPLFKNVENQAIAKFIKEYIRYEKQTFIALDEIKKYGTEAAEILTQHSVIQLTNEEVLFTKDWRKR